MESAELTSPALVTPSSDEPGSRARLDPNPASRPPRHRPTLLFVALICTAAMATVGLAGLFWYRFDTVDRRLAEVAQGNADLTRQSEALRVELQQLHRFVASKTSEDVIFLKIMVTKPDVDRSLAREIAHNVHHYSRLYGQDPDLVLAIMAVESGFNPTVVSHKGAVGLMQVMPQWKQVLGIAEELTDPEVSIKYGLQILGFYSQMYKDREIAITAYNRGPGAVDMALMQGKNPINSYTPRVLKKYEQLRSMTVARM